MHFFLRASTSVGLYYNANQNRLVESTWNVMAHGDAREGKWRGNWRMECVASTLHTTSEHGVSSITTADAHTSAASSRLNWRPRRFKWMKSGFCACAITFQTQSTAITPIQDCNSVSRIHKNPRKKIQTDKRLSVDITHSTALHLYSLLTLRKDECGWW